MLATGLLMAPGISAAGSPPVVHSCPYAHSYGFDTIWGKCAMGGSIILPSDSDAPVGWLSGAKSALETMKAGIGAGDGAATVEGFETFLAELGVTDPSAADMLNIALNNADTLTAWGAATGVALTDADLAALAEALSPDGELTFDDTPVADGGGGGGDSLTIPARRGTPHISCIGDDSGYSGGFSRDWTDRGISGVTVQSSPAGTTFSISGARGITANNINMTIYDSSGAVVYDKNYAEVASMRFIFVDDPEPDYTSYVDYRFPLSTTQEYKIVFTLLSLVPGGDPNWFRFVTSGNCALA